ncbi:WSC domain-containing protein [Colletotrichum graminicola]|nr:WSC domain-containing protein [Colletotrichum graminicola]
MARDRFPGLAALLFLAVLLAPLAAAQLQIYTGSDKYLYQGCFNETNDIANTAHERALSGGASRVFQGNMTVPLCLSFCSTGADKEYTYAGMEYSRRVLVRPDDLGPFGQVRRQRVQPALRRQPGHGLRRRPQAERVQVERWRPVRRRRRDILGRRARGGVGGDVRHAMMSSVPPSSLFLASGILRGGGRGKGWHSAEAVQDHPKELYYHRYFEYSCVNKRRGEGDTPPWYPGYTISPLHHCLVSPRVSRPIEPDAEDKKVRQKMRVLPDTHVTCYPAEMVSCRYS